MNNKTKLLELHKDYDEIFNEILTKFIELTKNKFSAFNETDPAIILLQLIAYNIKINNIKIDTAMQESILSLATDNRLDNLGAGLSTKRHKDETDDNFRKRLLIINSISDNGTKNYYESIIRKHIPEVSSLVIQGPPQTQPGVVKIYCAGNRHSITTNIDIALSIQKFLMDNPSLKMLTDDIQVLPPEDKDFYINIVISLISLEEPNEDNLANKDVTNQVTLLAMQSIESYLTSSYLIGKDITPYDLSCLINSMTLTNALTSDHKMKFRIYTIDIQNPAQILRITSSQIANCTKVEVETKIIKDNDVIA
jgi:phage-related baseplate assembly protein